MLTICVDTLIREPTGFHPREVYYDENSIEHQSFAVVVGKCTVKYIDDIVNFDHYVDQDHCYFYKLKHDVNMHSFVTARQSSIKEVEKKN